MCNQKLLCCFAFEARQDVQNVCHLRSRELQTLFFGHWDSENIAFFRTTQAVEVGLDGARTATGVSGADGRSQAP